MNKTINGLLIIVFLAVMAVASGAFYVVDETQQVVLTRFGSLVGKPQNKAGLYMKMPFIDTVNYFDKRILEWDGDANQIPTKDKRFIWVDTTARWRIADPLKFMQSVRTEASAQTRLDDIIDASTRDIISGNVLVDAVRDSNRLINQDNSQIVASDQFSQMSLEKIEYGREKISQMILERAAASVKDYGIDLIDVIIKRINYVEEVRDKVYERMVSERKRAAEQFRSEGQGKKAEIEGQMQKELEQIRSEAYRTAQEIKGKADAQAIKIYAEAFNKDPEFFAFIRTLDTYRKTMNSDTTLILTTDNEFYHLLNGVNADHNF